MDAQPGYPSMDEYIRQFPGPVRERLASLRTLVRKLAPDAQEKISYQMPCFHLHGNLVYFAAHERHIGFYPTASGISNFRKELAPYQFSRGAVRFPMDKPLPIGLITKIVRFRVAEDLGKAGRESAGRKPASREAAGRPAGKPTGKPARKAKK